jgi:hypothetical protein
MQKYNAVLKKNVKPQLRAGILVTKLELGQPGRWLHLGLRFYKRTRFKRFYKDDKIP